MHLLQVDIGKTIRVVGFDGGRKLEHKLRELGVLPGNCARILRSQMDAASGTTVTINILLRRRLVLQFLGPRREAGTIHCSKSSWGTPPGGGASCAGSSRDDK